MKKLASLRATILDAPLKIQAKDLLTFAEKGTVRSWRTEANQAFLLTYTAHLIVTDYTGAPQDLMFVAVQWLHRECVDAADDAIHFHVDIIDHQSADVSLAVEITEIIAAPTRADGLHLVPVADPDAHGFDLTAFFPDLSDSP